MSVDPVATWEWLKEVFGELAVLAGGLALLFKWVLPRWEQAQGDRDAAHGELIERYEQQLQETKGHLETARAQIEEATAERRQITEQFLETMRTCITESNQVSTKLVAQVAALEEKIRQNHYG